VVGVGGMIIPKILSYEILGYREMRGILEKRSHPEGIDNSTDFERSLCAILFPTGKLIEEIIKIEDVL